MSGKSKERLLDIARSLTNNERLALQWLGRTAMWSGPKGHAEYYSAELHPSLHGVMETLITKLFKARVIKEQELLCLPKNDSNHILLSKKNLERLGVDPTKEPAADAPAHHFAALVDSKKLPGNFSGHQDKGPRKPLGRST